MPDLTEFCPAKINPYLAVTGRRSDGFHELFSVVSQVSVGDTLEVTETQSGFGLTCDDPEIPTDGSNLVIKAAEAFRRISGWKSGADFHLIKRLPNGAGLGGGSSDAVAALRALNRIAGNPLDAEAMLDAAAEVGSDCALFLSEHPVLMRGRGERIEHDSGIQSMMAAKSVLLMKPGFGVNTAWAYRELAAGAPGSYRDLSAVENDLIGWRNPVGSSSAHCFNSFWAVAAAKYPALPALQHSLEAEFGVRLHLSGSGSACFIWIEDGMDLSSIKARIRDAWGGTAWIAEAECLPPTKSS